MTGKVRAANDVIKELKGSVLMRKLASIFLLFVVAGCMLTGCGQSSLREAEALLETDLKAADSILASMPMPKTRRDRTLYSLLKTQIDYKMYRDIPNDSLIRIATDYYGTKYKDYHAAMAWYSLGCVSGLNVRDSIAADAYLNAMKLFPDTLIRYYALAEQNLGYIYLQHDMKAEALPMIKACHINAVRLKDSVAIAFCEFNIARFMLYNKEYDSAQSLFLKLKDSKWMSPSTRDIPLLELSKISLNRDIDYESAINYVDSFLVRNKHYNNYGTAYTIKADAYKSQNQLDSALFYYRLSLTDTYDPYTICDSYRHLAEIYSLKGYTDSATYCSKQVSAWTDTIVTASNSEIILRALLNHSQSNYSPKSKTHALYVTLIIVVCVLIIAAFSFLYYKKRQKEPQSTIELPESKIKDYSTQDPEARAVLLKSYSNRLQMCTNAFRATPEYKMLSSYRLSVKELNRNDRDVLFNQIKRSYLESITDIRIEIPDIGEKDILTVILRNQGLSIEQISSLFSITTDSVKKRLYRLSQRASADFLNIYGV